jgi:hypothetical protein
MASGAETDRTPLRRLLALAGVIGHPLFGRTWDLDV